MKGKLTRARTRFRATACLLAAALALTAFGSSLALAEKEPAPPQAALSALKPSGPAVPVDGGQSAVESGPSAELQTPGAAVEPQASGSDVPAVSDAAGESAAPSVADGPAALPIAPDPAADDVSEYAGGSALSPFRSLAAGAEASLLRVGAPAHAGQLTVAGGTQGDDWTYSGNVLTVASSTPLVIGGTSTQDRVVVQKGVTANVTLRSASIAFSDGTDPEKDLGTCAFDMSGATVNLTLEGASSLKSGNGMSGLKVPAEAALTIDGPGSLKATGGQYGAGIGGGAKQGSGAVTISGGTVTAKGDKEAAGIGGGWGGAGGTIEIRGGTVSATGGSFAAGIGGGDYHAGGEVTISGGTVTAQGGIGGAGIGGSAGNAGGNITISGGTVTAKGGHSTSYGWGAGIGAGGNGSGGTFKTALAGNPGNPFINTNKITDVSQRSSWNGVIIFGVEGSVYGSPVLALNAAVPKGTTLIVPENRTLTIGDGVTLVNNGTIENHHSVVKAGSGDITGTGALTSDSGLSLSFSSMLAPYDGAVQFTARVRQTASTSWGSAVASGLVTFKLGA